MEPLNPNVLEQRDNILSQLAPIDGLITKRLDYIVRTVFQTCGAPVKYWYVTGASEGEIGDIDLILGDSYDTVLSFMNIELVTEPTKHAEFHALIADEVFALSDGVPRRWLFEAFEQELQNGLQAYDDPDKRREAAKRKQIAAQIAEQKRAELAAIAMSKLSPDEIKALGL